MWHVLIECGGWLFWGVVALAVVLEFGCVAKELLGWAIGIPAIFVAVMTFFSDAKVFSLMSFWKTALIWVGVYIAAGVVWAVARWLLYALKRKSFFYDAKRRWAEDNQLDVKSSLKDWTEENRKEFLIWFARQWDKSDLRRGYGEIGEYRPMYGDRHAQSPERATSSQMYKAVLDAVVPKASMEKARITMWLMFWPFSMLCYLFEDLVVDFYKMLCRFVSKIARGINSVVFLGMKNELPPEA